MATTAVLNLKIDTRDFEKAEKKLNRGFGGIKAKTVALTASFVALGGTLKKAIQNFTIQEDAVNDLAAAFANAGDNVRALLPEYARFAAEIQKQTVFGDELILQQIAFARNLGVTEDKLKEATIAAIGLASRFKIDLKTAFNLIGRASKGQTQLLTRYGIILKEGSSDQEKFNQLLTIGAESFSLARSEAETTSGQLQQTANSWGDLTEKVGEFAVNTLKIPKLLELVNKGFQTLADTWSSAVTIAKQLSNIVGGALAKSFISIRSSVEKSAIGIENFFKNAQDQIRRYVALVKGDADKAFAIEQRLKLRQAKEKDLFADIDEQKIKQIASITNNVAKENKKLADDYFKAVEKAQTEPSDLVLKAIDRAERISKTTGKALSNLGITGASGDTNGAQKRSSQQNFTQALVKGTIEAQEVEKTSTGNKTEQKHLAEAKKQTAIQKDTNNALRNIKEVDF